MDSKKSIILASQSPRRRELMKLITPDFIATSSDVDETLPNGISPRDAVLHLSKIKAEPFRGKADIVIGADTVVAIDDRILGKPADDDDARQMLKSLSGREHSVYTGVSLLAKDREKSFFVQTTVKFFTLDDNDIEWYIATREHTDKAGSYGIQGYGALLVEKINGDYFNVVGLPISVLRHEIEQFFCD
jgi:septum formation protein